MTQEEINEIRRKEQARYAREWRKKNPQKAKAIKERYWAKKAAQIKSENMAKDSDSSNLMAEGKEQT